MPLKIDLPKESGVSGLSDLPGTSELTRFRNGKELKRCEEYLPKARQAWKEAGNMESKFDDEVDRIVIKKFGATNREDICFNLKKAGKYGVCTTNDASPRHWGFCSRSCHVTKLVSNSEPYEEAEYKYFENAPGTKTKFKRTLIFN